MNPRLQAWLAKEAIDVATLEQVYAEGQSQPAWLDDVIAAIPQLDEDHVWRATWLMQRAARDGRVDAIAVGRIADYTGACEHWIARLTLCQMLARTGCPCESREALYPFLLDCTGDRHVIVRAWALSALATFAEDPAYRAEIRTQLRRAEADPAKSMQARLRQLRRARREPRRGAPCHSTLPQIAR